MAPQQEQEVIVVGSGIAGLSATVTALQAGLKVTLVERATETDFGGNTRWSEAYLRMNNDGEVADDFEEQLASNAGLNIDPNVLATLARPYDEWPANVKAHPLPDPEVISRFAERAPPTLAWLKSFGLKFSRQPTYLLTQNTSRIVTEGGGLALIERLMTEARALGARILFRTTALELLRDDQERINGLLVIDPDGQRQRLYARNVILASGGFQGNQEMMTRYLGERAARIRPVAPGGYFNKGEGIRMALAAGAAPAGEYGSYHAEPVDPRSFQAEAVVFVYPYGVLLNKRGVRFVDEAPGTVDAHYDAIGRAIAEQPDGMTWGIFDAQIEDVPRWKTSVRTDIPAIEADTLAKLFELLGLPATALHSIEAFNAACPTAPQEFNALVPDHRSTQGLVPAKTHWSRPLIKGPFRAYPIISSVCFTFGGLKVNNDAQVLDSDGKPLPGLYAAGETVGLYHQVYPGSTSVLRGAVFGRLAAQHIARD